MIKKITLALILGLAGIQMAEAQTKIAYANYQAIMDSLPEVRDVQLQILDLIDRKSKALAPKADTLQLLYEEYDRIGNTLNEAERKQREDLIVRKETELEQLRQQGMAEVQQRENALMAPIRAKIAKAIQDVAQEMNIDMVLNEAESFGDVFVFYASQPSLNITQKVVEKLK